MPHTQHSKLPINAGNEIRRTEPKTEVDGSGFDFFNSFDGVKIRYGLWTVKSAVGTVVILGGRTEFTEKFYEDMHNWQARGYNVAAMDWRGQGLSHRELADKGGNNRERHYLNSFDDLIKDLNCFFDQILIPCSPKPHILMGHSQGGHSILRFLHDHGDKVDKAIVMSPMVDIHMPKPEAMVMALPKFMQAIGQDHRYVPGHKAFKDGRWGWRKKLTNDDDRFCDEDWFIKHKDRDLAVGGVTFRWLLEAKKSIKTLNSAGYPEAITTPILMFQAGDDEIVDNKAQTRLAKRLPNVGLIRISGAKHELLKETDDVREKVWQAIDHFMTV